MRKELAEKIDGAADVDIHDKVKTGKIKGLTMAVDDLCSLSNS